jgi:RecQ family ATP-dependent DNA helicase
MIEILTDRFPTRNTTINTEELKKGMKRLPAVLNQMGFSSLRKGQDGVVYHLLGGADVVCILPTSLGKTACFVVPTLCHEWKTIVISPLVALIRDQMKGLWDKGIAAGELTSLNTPAQNLATMKDWANGDLNFLYIAPERVNNEDFIQACNKTPPDCVVIDEAHSISSWSDNFRPSYKSAGDFINKFNPKVVAAFTATCPAPVEQDIRWVLGLKTAHKIVYYPRRTNLKLTSRPLRNNYDLLQDIRQVDGSTLIYCTTIKKVEEIAEELGKFSSEPIGFFHGQLSPATKKHQQDSFINGSVRVMLATSAFGMGIDKPDIRHVIERDLSSSVEAMTQQLGRASRDGKDALCVTYYSDDSVKTQEFFLRNSYPVKSDIVSVYNAIRSTADNNGKCFATKSQIASVAGASNFQIDSILANLTSENIVRRSKDKDCLTKIKVLIPPNGSDDKYDLWIAQAEECGEYGDSTTLYLDLEEFSEKLGFSSTQTPKKWLTQWSREKRIHLELPARLGPLEVLGNCDTIDFARLARRREEAHRKLQEVIEYTSIPDDEKHAFIEEKLGIAKSSTDQ